MKTRTTIYLVVVAMALLVYIVTVERHRATPEQQAERLVKLMPRFDPLKVKEIEIVYTNQTLRAERTPDRWILTSPSYPARSTAIDAFLNSLTELDRAHEIPAQEIVARSEGLSPFGLDPAWAVLKLTEATNVVQFRIGSKTLVGDRVYIQPVGASHIFTTSAMLLQHLPKSPNDWRNPLLLQEPAPLWDRITRTGLLPMELERDKTNRLWRLVEPMLQRADHATVEELLRQLQGTRIARFISDDPKADLEPYGLQAPEAELRLSAGSNAVFQVQFGTSPTNEANLVYARCLDHTNVVLVPRALLMAVQKPYADFRDHLLLSSPVQLVDRIDARIADSPSSDQTNQTSESYSVQHRKDNDWQIVEPFVARADPELMQVFLRDLASIEIIRFEKDVVVDADLPPYGLAAPMRQYALKTAITNNTGATNQLLVQVDFGWSPTNELDKIYCRRSDESSVYVIQRADMNRLERSAFTLRDRHIWQFASSNVTRITVMQHDQRHVVSRDQATKTWFRQDQVTNAAWEEILHRLGQLQADAWVSRGVDQAKLLHVDGSEYQLTLDVLEGGKPRPYILNLRLGTRGQPYGAVTLEEDQLVVFRFPAELYGLIMQYLSIPSSNAEP
jgi:hypothetical protein